MFDVKAKTLWCEFGNSDVSDVALVCEGGEVVRSSTSLLAASSPLLRGLLDLEDVRGRRGWVKIERGQEDVIFLDQVHLLLKPLLALLARWRPTTSAPSSHSSALAGRRSPWR